MYISVAFNKFNFFIEDNLKHCGITENFKIISRDAVSTIKYFSHHLLQYDLFYLHPPYDSDLYDLILNALAKSKIIAEEGVVVVEHRRKHELEQSYDHLRRFRQIAQGDSCLTFFSMERGIA